MLIRCSCLHEIMGNPKSKSENLTQTAQNHIIKLVKQELFGFTSFEGSKETEKGNVLEPFAIQGSGLIRARRFEKNTERRENQWISGECDIFDKNNRLIIDTKCSWSIDTHPFFASEAEAKVKKSGYDWQMQGYMWLFDCDRADIDFWLFPCPQELIGQYGDPEKLIDAVERIPLRKRVTTVTVFRDDESIKKIQEKAEHSQAFYQKLINEIRYTAGAKNEFE